MTSVWTYVNAPELLDAVEADDFLQKLVPVLLAARRLREPEGPRILKRVLNIEVRRVVEDGDDLLSIVRAVGPICGAVGCVGHTAGG